MNIKIGNSDFNVQMEPTETLQMDEGFYITGSGYTDSGIRIHTITDKRPWIIYPTVWNNAILIKVE